MHAVRVARDFFVYLTWVSAALFLLGVLGLTGLWLFNRHVLPQLVAGATQTLSARCSCTVSVTDARFRPFRGLILDGLVVTSNNDRLSFKASSATIRLETDAVLRLRDGLPAVPRIDDLTGAFAAIATTADAGLFPRTVVIDDAVVSVDIGGRRPLVLESPQATVRHERRQGEVQFAATGTSVIASEHSGGPGSSFAVAANADYRSSQASGEVDLVGLPLAVSAVRDGKILASLSVRTRPDGGFAASGAVAATGLSVYLPLFAPDEIGPLDLHYEFNLTTGDGDSGVAFDRGDLVLNDVSLSVVPTYDASEGSVRVAVSLPKTPVDDLLEAAPMALLGPLETLAADGTFAWELDLHVPLDAVSGMTWISEPRLDGFGVRRIEERVNPFKLNGAFVHVIEDEHVEYRRAVRIPPARLPGSEWALAHSEQTALQVSVRRNRQAETRRRVAARPPLVVGRDDALERGPEAEPGLPDPTYRYVRLDAISPWVVRAVLTAEDGDFFFHPGVNSYSLGRAIERNLEAGEVLLGASTISMQLAKMLFLDDRRVLARKLQEAFLVYLMEHEVPVSKERILELYLNIAEFGPGVYGIADAAHYYFRKHPRGLNAGEATWLASILPSPKRFHAYYDAGGISDGWFVRMKSIFDVMLARGRMTEAEHRTAVAARPRFWFETAAKPSAEAGAFSYSLES